MLSADLVISASVFMMVFATVPATVSFSTMRLTQSSIQKDMSYSGYMAAESIIMGAGYPGDWESSPNDLQSIGLASSPRALDLGKLSALSGIGYDDARNALFVSPYDFSLQISALSGEHILSYGDALDSTQIHTETRYAGCGNETCRLTLTLYGGQK